MLAHTARTPGAATTWRAPGCCGTQTLQGPRDRVVFHHLQPQQKISQLRLKMFARVRRYNESTEEWQQQVIEVPTDATDYWFARIHFVGKE